MLIKQKIPSQHFTQHNLPHYTSSQYLLILICHNLTTFTHPKTNLYHTIRLPISWFQNHRICILLVPGSSKHLPKQNRQLQATTKHRSTMSRHRPTLPIIRPTKLRIILHKQHPSIHKNHPTTGLSPTINKLRFQTRICPLPIMDIPMQNIKNPWSHHHKR